MLSLSDDHKWMQRALELAKTAEKQGEVPVGAVLVQEGKVVGEGYNRPIASSDPTAHAEILALRNAATTIKNYRLINTILYVTLEPCIMCVGAIVHARVNRVVFGALDVKAGAVMSCVQLFDSPFLNHRIQYSSGLLSEECAELLKQFFKSRRIKF